LTHLLTKSPASVLLAGFLAQPELHCGMLWKQAKRALSDAVNFADFFFGLSHKRLLKMTVEI
jgi:hypothetical protein